MKEEPEYLTTVKRAEVDEKLEEAGAFGAISKSAKYREAKKEQVV